MIVRMTLDEARKKALTPEEIEMLKRAAENEPTPDEDCPEYSIEEMREMKRLPKQTDGNAAPVSGGSGKSKGTRKGLYRRSQPYDRKCAQRSRGCQKGTLISTGHRYTVH